MAKGASSRRALDPTVQARAALRRKSRRKRSTPDDYTAYLDSFFEAQLRRITHKLDDSSARLRHEYLRCASDTVETVGSNHAVGKKKAGLDYYDKNPTR